MIVHQFPPDWTELEKKIYSSWTAEKILTDEEAYILDQALTKGRPTATLIPDAPEPDPVHSRDPYDIRDWNKL